MKRCDWVSGDIHTKYHDTEWGTPLHNDRKLFEFLILDAMQSGLPTEGTLPRGIR